MQHVAIFTTHPLFQRHFATDLELIQNHVDKGDLVTVLYCDSSLLACDINTYHEPGQCYLCQKTRSIGFSLLQGAIHIQPYLRLTEANKAELATLQTITFASLHELQTFMVDNYDAGMAALSSIVSYVMNAELDVQLHQDLIRRYIVSGVAVYRSIQNFLRSTNIDRFYLFNGRMAIVRAIMRACESESVRFTIHEAAAGNGTYSLYDDAMPHSIELMTRMIQKHWEDTNDSPDERLRKAEDWFKRRAQGLKVNGYSFVEHQQQGRLPKMWNPHKHNVVIFNSADFEFVWVSEEYQHHVYRNQLDGIQTIVGALQQYEDYHVYLRIHPNLTTIEHELRPLLQLHSDNLTIILPNDRTSTYALIEHADKVITFGSTVGIEAPYWGKPSILGGKALYQNLGSTYNPNTHEELMALVLNKELAPLDKKGALQYGYFYNSFGIPFQRYVGETFFSGTYNGKKPFANRWLFRAFTAYKRITPRQVQAYINHRSVEQAWKSIIGQFSARAS
ncbi:MAG: hypothetical protein NZ661_11965 [Candidatus Kapabacteria bacterium]|nr:hypothetical protein [Candidatus Kapabacteria bacterium]